ncbi:MAG: hypothetical protein MUE33_12505 [Cytophagaceae bacterium]|nr:hypothetical protein [Cytophagaceae bacterium]
MKRILLFGILLLSFLISVQAQIGINTTSPHPSAALDVQSSTQGLLLPRRYRYAAIFLLSII